MFLKGVGQWSVLVELWMSRQQSIIKQREQKISDQDIKADPLPSTAKYGIAYL